MDFLFQGISKAFKLLSSFNREALEITWLTLKISGTATFIALLIGLPSGVGLALYRFPGRRFLISLINTGMGLPPVVVGLFVALFLWRAGPLGSLNLMYTPLAMVIAQVIIAFPLIAGLTLTAIQQVDLQIMLQARALGASSLQAIMILLKEARLAQLTAVMAGFGGAISEVGAVLMVGGNLKGQTRVLTTAIVQETRMGKFEMAIALSIILLILSFVINYFLTYWQQKGARHWKWRSWK